MMAGQEINRDARREFVRADDKLPVYYEVFDEKNGTRITLDWELVFEDLEPEPEENPKLYELLFDINQKLNILIKYMSEKHGFNIPEAREVNISGGGLRFYSNDQFRPGEMIIIKTFLPVHSNVVKIKCEVIRVFPVEGKGFEVAVKFVDMDEPTRDKIIKYIFAKQRELLRHKK